MAIKNNFLVGVTSGLVAAMLAPVLIPALKRGSRPMAKGLIKGGMLLYDKGREFTAHAGEMVEDVMAEIQAEQAQATGASGEDAWGAEAEEAPSPEGGGHPPLRPVTTDPSTDRPRH